MKATLAPLKPQTASIFHFCSSLADDVWHPSESPTKYEWWYFDAISDDGRDAIVVIFFDNFIFSPRYNKFCNQQIKKNNEQNGEDSNNLKSQITNPESPRFPAVAFTYYRDGKPLYRAINEFPAEDFFAETNFPACKIGDNSFQFEATPYGTRFVVEVNAKLRGNRKLFASLEWLIVERDYQPNSKDSSQSLSDAHVWNLVSPRSDVTGKIEVSSAKDQLFDEIQFRGTGYHDHNIDSRWMPETVREWQWGRAHFEDATAVFYRYFPNSIANAETKVFLIHNNQFSAQNSNYQTAQNRRDRFGLHYPKTLSFSLNETGGNLLVGQNQVIDSSFFYLRFLSKMSLDLGDGRSREAIGITEQLCPNALRFRWLDWLINMRIGRNGNGSFLP